MIRKFQIPSTKFQDPIRTFVWSFVLGISCFMVLSSAPHALAQSNFVPLAGIPGLTSGEVADSLNLVQFFQNLYKYLIGVAATLAVIMIIWGGLEIATKDSVSKKQDGKERIKNALFGLVLVLSPVIVFSIINPRILNLSIGLSPLSTQPSTFVGGTTVVGAPTPVASNPVPSSTGCTVTPGYFQKATCPSAAARDSWMTSCTSGRAKAIPDGTFAATCDTTSGPATGPYTFIDVGSIFSSFQPVASTQGNPNNGSLVMQFAGQCKADGGAVCLVLEQTLLSPSCPPPFENKKCYNMAILCRDPALPLSGGKICAPTSALTTIVK